MNLRYTSRAKDDIELAFVWYERQRQGLGYEFLNCVETSIQLILENPKIYRVYYSRFHGCVIRRFPFSVFYTTEDKEIIVHSVFDSRQSLENRP